ncbi:MAG: N-acetyltransferase family protein [Hyphomonadaceae bacterium]
MTTSDRPALVIRPCFQQDLETVQLIYAHHVLSGTGTFETEPPSLDEMTERWSRVVTKGWPYVVASPHSDLSRVMGFAYAAQYRDRAAYAHTFEVSVYAAPTSLRQEAGMLMLNEVLLMLKADGVREAIAMIGDSYNAASIGLHAKLGFKHVGTLPNVGEKFGRALDVVVMQRTGRRRRADRRPLRPRRGCNPS